jgi:hypothetical protein
LLHISIKLASSFHQACIIFSSSLHHFSIKLASSFNNCIFLLISCHHRLPIIPSSSIIHSCRLSVELRSRCCKKTKAFSTHHEGLRVEKRRPS